MSAATARARDVRGVRATDDDADRRMRPVPAPTGRLRFPGPIDGGAQAVEVARRPVHVERSAALVASATVVVVILVLLGLAAFHAVIVAEQIRLDDLEERVEAQTDRQQLLRVRVAELASPERIVAEAERLGLAPASEVVLVPTGATAPSSGDRAGTSSGTARQ